MEVASDEQEEVDRAWADAIEDERRYNMSENFDLLYRS
jgi:hypothetical protein